MMDWQPIETAPRDGTGILLYYAGIGAIEGEWYAKYGGEWSVVTIDAHGCGCCSGDSDQPVAWMPLPEPPEDSK